MLKGTRRARKAGSWYTDDASELNSELDEFLKRVPDVLEGSSLPISGAQVIIAPHAGYYYSGPAAAWAYKALDLSTAKRVFILGPSHVDRLDNCALTTFAEWATPFGNLVVDESTTRELKQSGIFKDMAVSGSAAEEHSIEMHLPYLWKRLEQVFGQDSTQFPRIVPILVGNLLLEDEVKFGKLLAPYLKDPESVFIISSDFCHWGYNYHYTPHCTKEELQAVLNDSPFDPTDRRPALNIPQIPHGSRARREALDGKGPIHETIKMLDDLVIQLVEKGDHYQFCCDVTKTGNTVCGRHPIGVVLAALEVLKKGDLGEGKGSFKFIQYQRSNLVQDPSDFSVSYPAAYAIL